MVLDLKSDQSSRRRVFAILCLLVFALCALAGTASVGVASGAESDSRRAIVAQACGSATLGEAGRALLALASDGSSADREWGASIAAAVIGHNLSCDKIGATIEADGGTRDAVGLAPRDAEADAHSPVLNLRNRGLFETTHAALALTTATAREKREAAIRMLQRRAGDLPLAFFYKAAAVERDLELRRQIEAMAERAALSSPDTSLRIAAIAGLAAHPDGRTRAEVAVLMRDKDYGSDPAFKAAVDAGLARIDRGIMVGTVLATLYSGLSLASILFMAAIGLAVIFGLMGVINLAQGEMIMIGAYTTWLVQQGLRNFAPRLVDYYLVLAIPVAFLVTALIGMALETVLLRHLYKRPLMSLLATWAVSLFLTNLVRVTFGTQNLDFVTPFYVSGGTQVIGDFVLTWNRLFAIVFAAVTLALTFAVLRLTPLGLNIRAVTQNRTMAACIGIPVRRVDSLAFGLGSGLAGLAGLALAPIYSVNPQMGQGFIIDSFMVVVLGGVGTIAGTVVASLGIGQINVLIEPIWGAVAAKVIVLLMIIAFLQVRPEGLFTVRGKRK